MAAGEAERLSADVILTKDWESPREPLSYVRVWADAIARVLAEAGIPTRQILSMSDRLDTASLERGLAVLGDLGQISVEDILAGRKIFVSRVADGPFVLEVTEEQAVRGASWLAESGLPSIVAGAGLRLALGTERGGVVPTIVAALKALEGSPATTLVARFSQGQPDPWPMD